MLLIKWNFTRRVLFSTFNQICVCYGFFCWFDMISWRVLTVKIEFTLVEMVKALCSPFERMRFSQQIPWLCMKFMGYIVGTLWSLAIRSHRMELNLIWIYQAIFLYVVYASLSTGCKIMTKKSTRAHTNKEMSLVRASQQTLANIEQYQLCCKKSAESNARAHNHSRCECVCKCFYFKAISTWVQKCMKICDKQ